MMWVLRVMAIIASFGVTAFCVFGFLASFEPVDSGSWIMFRLVYGIVGVASGCFGGIQAIALLKRLPWGG